MARRFAALKYCVWTAKRSAYRQPSESEPSACSRGTSLIVEDELRTDEMKEADFLRQMIGEILFVEGLSERKVAALWLLEVSRLFVVCFYAWIPLLSKSLASIRHYRLQKPTDSATARL